VRLTVVGCGTARTHPDTPASGLLVTSELTSLLIDCGPGVIARLSRVKAPGELSAIVVTHLHFDHYLDLVALRYWLAWGGQSTGRARIYLPPDGRRRLAALEDALSEREGFFDDAMDIVEFDPDGTILVGEPPLELRFAKAQHYVPAWSVVVTDRHRTRLVYAGDTGPTGQLTELAQGADGLVLEATLATTADDDEVRGHLTAEEAIDIAAASGARRTLIVHYPPERRTEIERLASSTGGRVVVGLPDLELEVAGRGPNQAPNRASATLSSPARRR
jgi:ribonuclease BN (tRNA processing enzyme)